MTAMKGRYEYRIEGWFEKGCRWDFVYSATTRPPIALCISLMWSTPFPGAGLELPLPFIILGPRPGCLTPRAAPSILLPGSPILGPLKDS